MWLRERGGGGGGGGGERLIFRAMSIMTVYQERERQRERERKKKLVFNAMSWWLIREKRERAGRNWLYCG